MRIKAGDFDLHYDDHGAGTPVVWIHGFPLSSKLFTAQHAIGGYRHIFPDLPGFGESPAPEREMTIDDYARAVLALLDALRINSAFFAGVSMGGYICFAIARQAPHRVKGVILIDTKETSDSDEARQGRYKSVDAVADKGVGVVVEQMLPKMLTEKTRAANSELNETVRTMMAGSSREGVIQALRAMAVRPDSAAVLRELEVPVLIVVGENDPITPPADGERMKSLARNAELVKVPNAAHLSNMEQPEAVNEAIARFLERTAADPL